MRHIKKAITVSDRPKHSDSPAFWISRTSEERLEAVEILRGHRYLMLGFNTAPRIKKTVVII
jgi:hypothetical protein